jgi:hypothetical protein
MRLSYAGADATRLAATAQPSVSSAFDLRRQDFSLDDEQAALEDAYSTLLEKARSHGGGAVSDAALWSQIVGLGAIDMIVSQTADECAGLIDLVLVVYQLGYGLVGSSYIDTAVALRLLTALERWDLVPAGVVSGEDRLALALDDLDSVQPLPSGAVARWVLGVQGSDVVLHEFAAPFAPLDNPARLPVSRWPAAPPQRSQVLAAGPSVLPARDAALREWRLLTAAYLGGVAGRAVDEAVSFATHRRTRGVSIGSLQAVAHLIVDADVARVTSRNLTLKAAWFEQFEPQAHPQLTDTAFVHAVAASRAASRKAVHVQGGQGVALESAVSRCFMLAEMLPMSAGDPAARLDAIADSILAQARPAEAATEGELHGLQPR